MSKFVIKNIESVKGKQQFNQLVILPDSADAIQIQLKIDNEGYKKEDKEIDGQLDIYEKGLEAKYKKPFNRILTIMDLVAQGIHVPGDKYHELVNPDGDAKEYEFKCGDLRVYAIKSPTGKLIILGGYKNQQKPDITKFRSLKKQYLEYEKNKNEKK